MFEIGQRVVCIDAKPRTIRLHQNEAMPVKGQIYTVRDVNPTVDCSTGMKPGIRLEEIVNPLNLYRTGLEEMWFRATRFAPIRTTNIDVFLKMLEPIKETV